MTRNDFQDLSRNNPRDADMALFDMLTEQAERIATLQADLAALADRVTALEAPAEPAPAEEPAPAA